MLNTSYAVLQQIQRQFSNIPNLEEAKRFLKNHSTDLVVQISSATVWVLEWNVSKETISGTIELSLHPQLKKDEDLIGSNYARMRIETSDVLGLSALEKEFMKTIKFCLQK